MRRESHRGNRQHLGRHHRPAQPLQHARADQHLDRMRHAAQRGSQRKGRNANQEHAAAPHNVPQPPERQQAQGKGQHIGGHHPFDLCVARPQIVAHRGQRHIDDGHIDQVHEIGNEQDAQRQPAARVSGRSGSGFIGGHANSSKYGNGPYRPIQTIKKIRPRQNSESQTQSATPSGRMPALNSTLGSS